MPRFFVLALILTLGLMPACNFSSAPVSSVSTAGSALEGKLILPYRIQDSQVSKGFNPVSYLFGQAAVAADHSENAADNQAYVVPLTRLDLNSLRASIDGEPVTVKVRRISFSSDETTVEYRIDDLPTLAAERVARLEILTRDGQPLLGGIVRFVPGQVVFYDFDVHSTALLVKVRETLSARQVSQLSLAELSALELDPNLSAELASIRFLLRRDGTLKDHLVWSKTWNDGDDDDGDDDDRDDNNSDKNKHKKRGRDSD